MHDCQKFREDPENWIDGTARDLTDCEECRSFCEEADIILQATAGAAQPTPEFSEEYWNGFDARLRVALVQENSLRSHRAFWKWSGIAAAAVLAMVVTWTSIRPAPPLPPRIEIVDDHIQGLDPMVVTYLERSELFLRNYTKIEPSDVADIDDARAGAKQSLMEIGEQKELTGNFTPVRITLDQYENVLREIKNLESNDDLAEVQRRVRSSGLIANMKAYQPQVMLVSGR